MTRSPLLSRLVRFAAAVAAIAAALAVASCQGRKTDSQVVLKIASQKGGTKSLVLASKALDGAPYRVEWSEFPSAQTLLEAVSAGAADAGAVGDAPFLFAYAAGSKIKVVMATRASAGGSSTAILVREGSPIRTPADLKGKTIATGRGSIGHYLALRVLEQAGLSVGDVKFVFLSPGDAKAAFASGSIDAWSTWGSYVGFARLHDHVRVLADGRGLLSGVGYEAASDAAIAGKREALADFLGRLTKAQAWESTHQADYAAVLAKETGLPVDVALFTVSQARGVPTPIDTSIKEEALATLGHFVKAGVIPATPNIEGAFDPSFNAAVTGPAASQ